jgi:hypothetical protein
MPPRYAYWTILIDNKPTAFRARDQADLLPTLHQLRRTNRDVVMKWFARGRIWESPEAERARRLTREQRLTEAGQRRRRAEAGWRPGGDHKDPRERVKRRRNRKPRPFGPDDRRPRPFGPSKKPRRR